MTAKNERNPCVESGCKGACCADIRFTFMSVDDLKKITPDGTRVVEVPEENLLSFSRRVRSRRQRHEPPGSETTVYFSTLGYGRNSVLLDGPCPNLQPDNSCGIYDARPPQCRNFDFGSPSCNTARITTGLQPVDAEPKRQLLPLRVVKRGKRK